ncbi:DMP19 family protein [Tropicimonas aquimaris]|uniref:DUF4375 domain-containing protein n=1 Tax=Tropicimonas aquimaris TaxID=914152 RepID=A0ABW3IQ15_9RHOB
MPRSAVAALEDEPHRLVAAVVDYVNHLVSGGAYSRNDIPQEAIQLYHCDYYFAQVMDGGHSQFIGNSLANLDFILSDVSKGLRAAGAGEYRKIFDEMRRWVSRHPRKAQKLTGFEGGIAPEMEALDARFFELDAKSDLTTYLGEWIAALPALEVADDDAMTEIMAELTAPMDAADDLAVTRVIARISLQLSDPTHLGFGLAAASRMPPEAMVQLGGASSMKISEGREDYAFLVRTIVDTRFGVQSAKGFELFERVEGGSADAAARRKAIEGNELSLEGVLDFMAPEVGKRIAYVPRKLVDIAALVAERYRAAAAIDLMLRRLPRTPEVDYVSVRSVGKGDTGKLGMTLLIVTDKASRAFCAAVEADGARLLSEPDHDVLVTATRAEISAHAEKFAQAESEED